MNNRGQKLSEDRFFYLVLIAKILPTSNGFDYEQKTAKKR